MGDNKCTDQNALANMWVHSYYFIILFLILLLSLSPSHPFTRSADCASAAALAAAVTGWLLVLLNLERAWRELGRVPASLAGASPRACSSITAQAGAAGLLPRRRIKVRCYRIKIPHSQIELCSADLACTPRLPAPSVMPGSPFAARRGCRAVYAVAERRVDGEHVRTRRTWTVHELVRRPQHLVVLHPAAASVHGVVGLEHPLPHLEPHAASTARTWGMYAPRTMSRWRRGNSSVRHCCCHMASPPRAPNPPRGPRNST